MNSGVLNAAALPAWRPLLLLATKRNIEQQRGNGNHGCVNDRSSIRHSRTYGSRVTRGKPERDYRRPEVNITSFSPIFLGGTMTINLSVAGPAHCAFL